MSSLATCIKKAGKALSKDDVIAIREIRDEFINDGMSSSEANTKAIDEYLGTLADERADLTTRIEKAGGAVPTDEPVQVKEEIPAAAPAPEELPLRYKIDDDFTEKLVDKHPDTPIAQMSKLGAAVEEISEKAANDVSTIKSILGKAKDISIPNALAAVPQSKLPEFIRTGLRGISDYVRTMKRMDGFINERLEEQSETGGQWRDLIRKNNKDAKLLGEIINGSTLARTDPSKAFALPKTFAKMKLKQKRIWMKRQRDHTILKKAWDKLSPDAQALYKKVRDDYKNLGTEVMEALEKRIQATEADEMAQANLIAELRKRFEKGRIEPFFHLARFGKHWGTAKDPTTGEVIAFIKRESRAERDQWVAEMRKAGFDATRSQEKSSSLDNVRQMDPNFVAKVTAMTEGLGKEGQALADEIWQMYLRSLPEMSARTAFIHRIGRLGFTGDALRAYGYHMFHGTHQLGKLNYGFQLQGFLDNVDQEAKELTSRADRIRNSIKNDGADSTHEKLLTFPGYKKLFDSYKGSTSERIDKAITKFIKQAEIDAPWAQPLADEMQQRHDYNMNPTSSLLSTQLTKLGFFWFLSSSPAAGMLNLTQTAIVGLPTLGARFNNMSGAAGALMRASGQLARTRGDLKNTLRGDERKAFEEFDRIGMFSKTRVRDLTGYAERGEDFTGQAQRLEDIASWIFHHTEKWNREVTGLAAYRMSRKAGRSHDAAILEAEELVEMSHFDYTNTNRPRFMQKDAARVVFLFRNYSLNMTYRLIRDFRDGFLRNTNVDVEVRNEAARRLTGILGVTFLFAGLSGQPLGYAFHAIADAMLGDDDEPYDSQASMRAYLTEIWGEDMATFITKGAWDTFTDTTLSTRASLNNLWIREIPDKLSGKEFAAYVALEAMGPLAGIAANALEGADAWGQGHAERGMEKMVPKAAADAMKAIRYATEGALNYDRDVIMGPEEFTNWNLASQALGFTPTPLTTRYEQQRAVKDYEAALLKRKKDLMDRLFMAAKLEDKAEVNETMKLLVKFSKKNPALAISAKGIMQSAKVRADYDRRAVMGTTVSKKLHYLHGERSKGGFRMTDKPTEEESE